MSQHFTLAQVFKAARRPRDSQGYWRPANIALRLARANLAAYAEAEAEKAAAYAELTAAQAADSRRYAPGMVKARSRALWRACYPARPIGRGGESPSLGAPFQIGGYRSAVGQWCESFPGRFVGLSSDLIRLDHTGHYCDPDGDGDLARGVVYQLAAKDGRARYVPAIADPCNSDAAGRGPAVVAFRDMVTADDSSEDAAEEARQDAARRADQLAEYYAESERDYQEAFAAGREVREAAAEVKAEGLAWVAAIRALRGRLKARRAAGLVGLSPDSMRGLIRAAVAEARAACESYQEAKDRLRDLKRDKAPASWAGDSILAAFREGYAEGPI